MNESIYNLIPQKKPPVIKPDRYLSKYNPKQPPTGSTFGMENTTSLLGALAACWLSPVLLSDTGLLFCAIFFAQPDAQNVHVLLQARALHHALTARDAYRQPLEHILSPKPTVGFERATKSGRVASAFSKTCSVAPSH